jgi:hypothetical protein
VRWLNKWWHRFLRAPETDFADASRAPHTSPRRIPAAVEQAIVRVRQARARGRTGHTRFGLIGHRSVQTDLEGLQLEVLPSLATIQRVMSRHGLTHPLGAGSDAAYYPWPAAWAPRAIQATDLITRHLRGGQRVENVHTIDLYSLAVVLTQAPTKSSALLRQHLLKTWAELGWPAVHQTDNEAIFRGGHTHPRVIGQVVRLCLFCGVEPLFTPEYEPQRNYQVETFHSVWVRGFWARRTFTSLAQVRREAPAFARWYHTAYRPPSLEGLTPEQASRGPCAPRLDARLGRLIPTAPLPITAGRIHFLRQVDAQGQVSLLNETWALHPKWVGQYVRATINLAEHRLSFWHQADAQSAWVHLKTRRFTLEEPIHTLLPEFIRHSERCREQWPD